MKRLLLGLALLPALSGAAHAQQEESSATTSDGSQTTHDDGNSDETATANQLFFEGRRLMASQDYVDACVLFERAAKIRRTVGILLNLGDCYESLGRAASAHSRFALAAYTAHLSSDPREPYARQRMASLEPKIVRLTVDTWKVQGLSGVEILLDGNPLQFTSWGRAVAVDSGRHTVGARAPGKMPWEFSLEVSASMRVVVPGLRNIPPAPIASHEAAPAPAPSPAVPLEISASTPVVPPVEPAPQATPAPVPSESAVPPAPQQASWLGTHKVIGLSIGAGLAGLGVGTVFGIMASSAWNRAESACGGHPHACTDPASGNSYRNTTETDGTISTVGFIAGGVLVAVGAAVFLKGRHHEEGPVAGVTVTPGIGPGQAGVGLSGAF